MSVTPLNMSASQVTLHVLSHSGHSQNVGTWSTVPEKVSGKIFLSYSFPVPKCDSTKSRHELHLCKLNGFIATMKLRMLMMAPACTVQHLHSRLIAYDLESAYWYKPITNLYQWFMAVQMGQGYTPVPCDALQSK